MKLILGVVLFGVLANNSNAYNVGRNEVATTDNSNSAESNEVENLNQGMTNTILGLMRAQVNYKTCIFNVITSADFESATTRADVYKRACKTTRTKQWRQCQKDFKTSVRPYAADRMEAVDVAMNMTDSIISYGCDNNAKTIIDFEESGGVECFQQRLEQIIECAEGVVGVKAGEANANDIAMAASSQFNNKAGGCSKLGELRKCFVKNMRACTSRTPATIVNNLFLRVENILECPADPAPYQRQTSIILAY